MRGGYSFEPQSFGLTVYRARARLRRRKMLIAAFDRYVRANWRAIDADYLRRPTGPVDGDTKAVVTLILSAVILTCMQYIVLRGGLQTAFASQLPELVSATISESLGQWLALYRPLLRNIAWSMGCAFFYFVVPAIVIRVFFKERLSQWGLSPQNYFKHLWIYVLLFLPVAIAVVAVSFTPGFQQSYPFYKSAHGWGDFFVWEAFYALQFVALEFFFRGFMLRGLTEKMGKWAVLAMVVPYCMIHFQKPMLETFGAIVAGLILGILALRTRSIWGGATIHVAVAVSMDLVVIFHGGGLH
jgi:membrane protease YdiL (CAAX protease family)